MRDMPSTFVALVTPMCAAGGIDWQAWRELLAWHVKYSQGVLILGTTGEAPTIHEAERLQLIIEAKRITANQLPLWVGISSNDSKIAIGYARQAEALGADGCMLSLPYYNRPTQQGIIDHFRTVAEQMAGPLMLYHVPTRTSSAILPSTWYALTTIPRIVAVKDAAEDCFTTLARLQAYGSKWHFYSGQDSNALAYVQAGGYGSVSVAANLLPQSYSRMIKAAKIELRTEAERRARWLGPLFSFLESAESNPISIKWLLHLSGKMSATLRLPLQSLQAPFWVQAATMYATLRTTYENEGEEFV
jgi:4-hydroxy-tetrahydrodipicolinate synthase